ncbi:helix-turn-helix transcriptional regulator [Pseudoalteromonas sp. MMG013]|uniref:AraC family transcriptional regulator n=1 Tax=Pseudoalteromonas sp. MMG013 TaxID=2822687 RepID=UPI001B371EDE|nr:helix-turn-helix transcriptional regulator [Pseudoalteromonas sp. MMG013]MBQ4863922.1 helix-turn-helix transcriptional regulator [Pseudoalteromonas sp. MMG013]
MTDSLPDQTHHKWKSVKSGFKLNQLNKPIFPRAMTMPPWQHVYTHQHSWGQLAYTSNGVMTVGTPVGRFVIPPNQALWLPPNLPHEIFCRYGGHFRSVYIDKKYVDILGLHAKLLHVDELLKAMILDICSWGSDYCLDGKTLRFIQVFIDRLEMAQTSTFFIPTAQDKRLIPIISELHANPGNPRTLEQWSEHVGASSRTLNRLFNKSFSMNFSQWKQKLRALRAVEMLEAGQTQQFIAEQLGFESSSAFNTAFKKAFNCTPGQYLKK